MTVSSTQSRTVQTGNGVTTAFTAPFKFLANSDIAVYLDDVKQNTGFSTSGAGGASGTVTFATAPAVDVAVSIVREMPYTQETSLAPNGPFPARSVEGLADRAMLAVQQMIDAVGRTLKFPVSEGTFTDALPSLAARVGKFLGFDADGNPVALSGSGSDAGLRTDLAAGGGSALVATSQGGTGAQSASLQTYVRRRWVDAEDFDTLQRAINTGRHVMVSSDFELGSTVTIATARQRLDFQPGGVLKPTFDGDLVRVTAQGVWAPIIVDGSLQPGVGTAGAAITIGYGGANAQQCSIQFADVQNYYGHAYLWEQGSKLNALHARAYNVTGDGIRCTANYNDNNEGVFINTHMIACAGTGYRLMSVGAMVDNNNSRGHRFSNAKGFGCGRNFDIDTGFNQGTVMTELGTNPDQFGAYSFGNKIQVLSTPAALQSWVDNGTGNWLEGCDSFNNWSAQKSYFKKLSINARHEGYRELSQSGDRAFTDEFSGTAGDVTVTHGKGSASSRTDIFERVQFASSLGNPLEIINTYSGYEDVAPGVIASGAHYQSVITGVNYGGEGDSLDITPSKVASYGGLDFTHYIHLDGSLVYRITNTSGGGIDPGTIRLRWVLTKHG